MEVVYRLGFAHVGRQAARANRWSDGSTTSGVAVDGPFAGTALERATGLPPVFWLDWSELYPGTAVYGRG